MEKNGLKYILGRKDIKYIAKNAIFGDMLP